ncbi:MAG: NMD3-related protein [Candidatus Thermoplasmatota archaeon]
MFCVKCGKETKIFRNGLCLECYLEENKFTEGPKNIDLYICAHCGSIKYKDKWTNKKFEELLKKVIKDIFKISNELKDITIDTKCREERERISCEIIIKGYLKNSEIKEKHQVFVRFKRTVCDVCSKMHGGYHEAILQIRAQDRDLTEKELDEIVLFVNNKIRDLNINGNRNLFIADQGQKHGGFDFFISNKKVAYSIIKDLQDKIGGEITKSSENIGMRDGEQIYRMTYLLRAPSFKKKDFVFFEDRYYYVKRISRNKVHLVDLKSWESMNYKLKKMGKTKVVGSSELIEEMILVSQNKKEAQLMDRDNYKLYTVRKPKAFNFNSDKVKIVKIDEKIFFLPKELM